VADDPSNSVEQQKAQLAIIGLVFGERACGRKKLDAG
jgi:hypothetical protein